MYKVSPPLSSSVVSESKNSEIYELGQHIIYVFSLTHYISRFILFALVLDGNFLLYICCIHKMLYTLVSHLIIDSHRDETIDDLQHGWHTVLHCFFFSHSPVSSQSPR